MFVQELEDVLILVKDLKSDDQKLCARLLRNVVRATEDRDTMTWRQQEELAQLKLADMKK